MLYSFMLSVLLSVSSLLLFRYAGQLQTSLSKRRKDIDFQLGLCEQVRGNGKSHAAEKCSSEIYS